MKIRQLHALIRPCLATSSYWLPFICAVGSHCGVWSAPRRHSWNLVEIQEIVSIVTRVWFNRGRCNSSFEVQARKIFPSFFPGIPSWLWRCCCLASPSNATIAQRSISRIPPPSISTPPQPPFDTIQADMKKTQWIYGRKLYNYFLRVLISFFFYKSLILLTLLTLLAWLTLTTLLTFLAISGSAKVCLNLYIHTLEQSESVWGFVWSNLKINTLRTLCVKRLVTWRTYCNLGRCTERSQLRFPNSLSGLGNLTVREVSSGENSQGAMPCQLREWESQTVRTCVRRTCNIYVRVTFKYV